jgi:hypothetical protein
MTNGDNAGMATRKLQRAGQQKPAAPAPRLGHGEYVVYPGTRAEVYDLLERLSAVAGDSPDFGTPGIGLDRTRLTVRWFGDLPPAVRAVVDSAAAGVRVAVESTAFRPGDLRAEAARLVADHPDVVQSATARPEGDGIDVLVLPAVAEAAGTAEQALARAGVGSQFPVLAEIGGAPS